MDYGYTWQITVKMKRWNCQTEEWEDVPSFVKTPELGNEFTFGNYENHEAAIKAGDNYRKPTRDEAKKECESSCSAK